MNEAIYKVGDILEIESQYGMFSSDKKSRCLVLKCIKPGYEFIIYTLLVLKTDNSFAVIGVNQKDIILAAKRVGHIDISSFLSDDEESTEPDYAMFFTAATIAQAADLKNENEKLKAENEALSDTLSKSEAKAQSRLDMNEVLKRENEELRGHNKELGLALSKSEKKCKEATHEIDRLRTVIGGLNEVIDDLNSSKSEISDLFYSLKNALQTNDILEGVNKLKKENERLSNENGNLKTMNDDLRSSWIDCCTSCKQTEENKKLMDETAKLSLKLHDADEKIRKLEEENGKLVQKISCADNFLAEAANRLYQGRAHLNISAHN